MSKLYLLLKIGGVSGIHVKEDKALQPENAYSPKDVKWLVIVALFNPVQDLNALYPIVVTELGMFTLFSPVQPENALLPMVVTDSGIVMLVSPVQPWNAYSPIDFKVFGSFTDKRLVQYANA